MTISTIRILVIEDDASIVLLITRMLARLGYEVAGIAATGVEAIRLALATRPDLALVDIKLEGDQDGIAVAAHLRAYLSLPVIYLTAHADAETLRRAKETEPDGYLVKPFQEINLQVAIDMALHRHKMQQALRDSEERWRSLVEQSQDGIMLMDERGLVVEWNKSQAQLTGLTRAEVLGRPLWDAQYQVMPAEQKGAPGLYEQIKTGIEDFLQTGDAPWFNRPFENEIQRPDGTRRFMQTIAFAIKTSQGMMVASIMRDITERKQAEQVLAQRAVQLTIINDIGRQIAAELKLDNVLEQATRLVQTRFDYHHVALFLIESNALKLKAVAGAYTAYFPPGHTQPLNQGLNGWVVTRGQKIVANDVRTEPRYTSLIAEHTVIQAELSLPIKIGPDTVGVVDIQSPVLNAFTDNDVLAMETLTGQIAVAIINSQLYEAAQQELVERQRAEQVLQTNLQQTKIAYDQATIYAQQLAQEVKERKQAQAALSAERSLLAQRVEERTAELSAAVAELERAARLKDEFLANMSHELRTPLNSILGMAEILEENVYGELNPKQQQSVGYIEESGRHLLALITDILDMAKIEAGKTELLITPVVAQDVCQASLLFIKQTTQKKQINVVTAFDPMIEVIQADERRLKQILVNLLSNAAKFTPEGGQVGLEVTGDTAAGVAHFVVWDTGIGIAQEDMPRLFRPFEQLDNRLSRQYEGSGLGLALVYRLAKLHGGSVAVESEGPPGQGSRFTVSLPWVGNDTGPATAAPLMAQSEAATAGETSAAAVLLVEDNEANIATIVAFLHAKAYQVVTARSGVEALERIAEKQPDIILMDIQMPGMDGLDVIRYLRTDATFNHIPIIALTALAMPGDRERCLAAGANEYLSKPVSLKKLTQLINELVKKSQAELG